MSDVQYSFIIVFIFLVLAFLFVSFIYLWLFVAKKQNLLEKIKPIEEEKGQKVRLQERLWVPIIKASEYVGPTAMKYQIFTNQEKDEAMLTRAGNPHDLKYEGLHGMRYFLFFSLLTFGTFWNLLGMPFSTIVLLLFPIGGFMFPSLWLRYKARERQEQINIDMPDFLDTVSVTLQAGVSLDRALKQVTRHMDGPLSEEMGRFLRELDLGVPRRRAYQNITDRNDSKSLSSLVNSLIQGGDLGVSVSTTFRTQADDLRSMRGYVAREKAAKASPKITLVATFLIVPSVFLLIVGLLLLNLLYNPGAFGLDHFFQ